MYADPAEALILGEEPENDYGKVRDRRDFQPLDVGLRPILPCPYRDFTFTALTGWRYYPTKPSLDRLGTSRLFNDKPSTIVDIPESWKEAGTLDEIRKEASRVENTKRQLEGQDPNDAILKRPRTEDHLQSLLPSTTRSLSEQQVTRATPDTNLTQATVNTNFIVDRKANINTSTVAAAGPKMNAAQAVPKGSLYALYGKKPRRVQLAASDYITWDNKAPTHELKFTSVFICPITKECFLAGRYGETYDHDGSLVWYTKKILAEHAAAARALDCWNLREQARGVVPMGLDEPYWKAKQPALPDSIPTSIMKAIEKAQKGETSDDDIQMKTTAPAAPPQPQTTSANHMNVSVPNDGDNHSRNLETPLPSQQCSNAKRGGRVNGDYPSGLPPKNWNKPPPQPRPYAWRRNQQQYKQQRNGQGGYGNRGRNGWRQNPSYNRYSKSSGDLGGRVGYTDYHSGNGGNGDTVGSAYGNAEVYGQSYDYGYGDNSAGYSANSLQSGGYDNQGEQSGVYGDGFAGYKHGWDSSSAPPPPPPPLQPPPQPPRLGPDQSRNQWPS